MNNKWILAVVLAVTLLAGLFMYNRYRVAPQVDFSTLKLKDLDGGDHILASPGKRPAILCLGASWCGACHQELNELKQVQGEFRDVDVVVISDESPEKVRMFRERGSYPFEFYRLDQPFSSLGVHSIPTTYLLNAEGKVVKETTGRIQWKDQSTREHMKRILKQ